MTAKSVRPFTIVSGDFARSGGMDWANYALANYLVRAGRTVHIVGYRIASDLAAHPNVVCHRVPRPANAYALGAPFLGCAGITCAVRMARRGGATVVNGGNCLFPGANWVHYVHAGREPIVAGGRRERANARAKHATFKLFERLALSMARLIIANSEKTKREIIERLGIAEERIRTVYYGIDPVRFRPATAADRERSLHALGWQEVRPRVAFVGALGDRRKGFDVLYEAWRRLCRRKSWDVDLVVVGRGRELDRWRELSVRDGIADRIEFLGHREDVPTILSACDALVAPSRYEAYGLGVHEALCCGIPALVSRDAGVAERYPPPLRGLLLEDPESVQEVESALDMWRAQAATMRAQMAQFSETLRTRTWDIMSDEIASLCETFA